MSIKRRDFIEKAGMAAAGLIIMLLSEASIANNGEVQDVPDFTWAKWIIRKPYQWMKSTW